MVKPHRVPQSVFDVEFKLFDIMSMKQFVIVMVTAGFAVLFYFLLDKITAPFIKWAVVSSIVIVGLIVAFLKFQGEPFEVYVTNFILALVSPQRRVWSKANQLPEYLKDSPAPSAHQLAQTVQKAQKASAPTLSAEAIQAIAQAKSTSRNTSIAQVSALDEIERQYLEGKLPVFGAVRKEPSQPAPSTPQSPPQQQTVQAPVAPVTPVAPETHPQMNISDQPVSIESLNDSSATPPQTALRPNVLSGEVCSIDGKPIATAIINIRENGGSIIRALTSNALGQFASADPLQNGRYMLELNKSGYKFPKYKLECTGTMIPSKRYLGQPIK